MRPGAEPDEWVRGRWKVQRKITSGGMGEVYLVFDKVFDGMLVAAKSFKPELFAASATVEQRFLREAANWIKLDFHPNVTAALYMDRFDERPFLFLEYVPGGDLADWLETSRQPGELTPVLRFAANICDGMAHILENGMQAHRDLKPANCLIAQDGTLKISDFGLSRVFDDADLPQPAAAGTRPVGAKPGTATGAGFGTPPYMAPEQFVDAKRADVRSDVYSFGVMLCQMVTGSLPYVALSGTAEEYEYLHLTAAPPEIAEHPALSTLIARCLAKNPADRFADFTAIRRALETATRGSLPPPPSGRPGQRMTRGMKLIQIADSLNVLHQQDQALAYCEEALAIDADDAWALTVKAKCLAVLGRLDEALACLERASRIDPDSEDTWRILGGLLAALGRAADAVAAYDRALTLSPDREEVWTQRGNELLALRRDFEALQSYERALQLDGRSAMAWFGKAVTLAQLGRRREALSAADRVLELEPSHPQAARLRTMLRG